MQLQTINIEDYLLNAINKNTYPDEVPYQHKDQLFDAGRKYVESQKGLLIKTVINIARVSNLYQSVRVNTYDGRDMKLYQLWDEDNIRTWRAFTLDFFGLSYATINNYQNIEKYFSPVLLQNPELQIEYTKLISLIPLAKKAADPVVVNDLLFNANSLNGNDFKQYVRGLKGLETDETCTHNEYTYIQICKGCGTKRVFGQEELKEYVNGLSGAGYPRQNNEPKNH